MEKQTETYEIDANALKAIADSVTAGLASTVEATVEKVVNSKVEAIEKTVSKDLPVEETQEETVQVTTEQKAVDLMKAAFALRDGNKEFVKAYNQKVLEARQKAGYANTGVNADGGYIVMQPEFEAEIEKIQANYGVAFSEATVQELTSNSIITNKRGTNVSMYETAQGGVKTGTKLTISQVTVALRKFAAIAPLTDELSDDAAIDFWNELRQGFVEERGRIADTLVFTENGTVYKGLLRMAGTIVEPISGAISTITWDDLMNAETAVPTNAAKNGKFYMHRSVWNVIKQNKAATTGEYMFNPGMGLMTPWGTPVVLVDVMPSITDVDSDGSTPYVIFGDLKRVKLYVKKGLVLDVLSEGTVHGSDGSAINLGEQDMKALRAVTRMVALCKFPEAFCVIGSGSVS
jgi:HK97 family phage major capsid protein